MPLRALALNCSLKGSGPSSTDRLLRETLDALVVHGVEGDGPVRLAALNVLPGVSANEGPPDEWPTVRRRILDADILVLGTPIWLGHPSSIAQRVLERLDADDGDRLRERRAPGAAARRRRLPARVNPAMSQRSKVAQKSKISPRSDFFFLPL
jgi:multimeric flavodoxin WrbA